MRVLHGITNLCCVFLLLSTSWLFLQSAICYSFFFTRASLASESLGGSVCIVVSLLRHSILSLQKFFKAALWPEELCPRSSSSSMPSSSIPKMYFSHAQVYLRWLLKWQRKSGRCSAFYFVSFLLVAFVFRVWAIKPCSPGALAAGTCGGAFRGAFTWDLPPSVLFTGKHEYTHLASLYLITGFVCVKSSGGSATCWCGFHRHLRGSGCRRCGRGPRWLPEGSSGVRLLE